MDWVSTLLTSFGLARDLSWAFACPSHCGSSFIPAFLAGTGFGLIIGLVLGLWIIFQISHWAFREPRSPQVP